MSIPQWHRPLPARGQAADLPALHVDRRTLRLGKREPPR
jgi:hypothetical protein